MSAATHTPGPWSCDQISEYTGGLLVRAANGDTVARVCCYGPQSETPHAQSANAALIAMAPTMLQALAEAAGALQGAAVCMRKVDALKTAEKLEEIALAAMLVLAKATGEQQS
jgi:hypothetical protein